MNEALVELGFMMVLLKLPIVYLCLVVWWAVRSEPRPAEGAGLPVGPRFDHGPHRRPGPRHRRPGPHGGPVRTYARRPSPRRVAVEP